jgi:hypothetical protein
MFAFFFTASLIVLIGLIVTVYSLRRSNTQFVPLFRYAMLSVALGAYLVFSLAWVLDSKLWLVQSILAMVLFIAVAMSRSVTEQQSPLLVSELTNPAVLGVNFSVFRVDRDTNLLVHDRGNIRCYVSTLSPGDGSNKTLASLIEDANGHRCEAPETTLIPKVAAA